MIDNLVKHEAEDQQIPSPQIIKKEQDTPKPSQPKKDKNHAKVVKHETPSPKMENIAAPQNEHSRDFLAATENLMQLSDLML